MTVKSGSGERGLERPRRDAAMYAAGAADMSLSPGRVEKL